LEKARVHPEIAAVVSDVRMPRMSGLEFLKALAVRGDQLPVILMTAYGEVADAVRAMKWGAVDFLSKPFKRQALLTALDAAMLRVSVRRRGSEHPEAGVASQASGGLLGSSNAMVQLREQISKVAQTRATILIQGESGTGKELVARQIHANSSRRNEKWLALNCGAVPESLLESELFGHERGAFTGAHATQIGLFEAADRGTLFLDEIAELPLSAQVKLLRVLQEGEIRRVGSSQARKIDVRLLAATHRDLRHEVAQGRFREDLLYRLEVIQLEVPPLRDRREDLSELISHFLTSAAAAHGKNLRSHEPAVLRVLQAHRWPGNIRELRNVIERAVVFAEGERIELSHLPDPLRLLTEGASSPGASGTVTPAVEPSTITVKIGTPLREVEDLLIRRTLEATEGDKNMTAKLLGINSRTIYRRLEAERDDESADL
jgi:two-component system response regulator HydG